MGRVCNSAGMSAHHHHGGGPIDPPQLREVSDGVYAYVQPDGTWWINNTGFVVADDGIIAVDTCATERRTRLFLDTVRSVSTAPLRVVVNTHHHGDHTHGNYLTHPAAIVGHDKCREAMLATGISHYEGVFEQPEWGHVELTPPMITFDDHLHLHAGDLPIELHYIGAPAHTTNDVVAWIPDRKVLFSGDLVFNGGTPFVVMGSVSGARAAIARLRAFGADVIVPGHGPVGDTSVLDSIDRYYAYVQQLATDGTAAGLTPLEIGREADLGEFADLTDSERLVGNLHRAVYELGGGEPGGPMNIAKAIGDMIAFNGGNPLSCRA
jgi:cyclase